MCRLAYINGATKRHKKKLTEYFEFLEESRGGHGNGIGGWVNGEAFVVKGVNKTVEELVDIALNTEWDNSSFIFHTRVKTVGGSEDENCQPFHHGDQIMAHNGTTKADLKDFKPILIPYILKRGGNISDSEAVSYLISLYGFGVLHIRDPIDSKFSGAYLSIRKDGILECWKSDTYKDMQVYKYGKLVIIGSEFPDDYIDTGNVREVPGDEFLSDWEIMANFDKLEEATKKVVYTYSKNTSLSPRESGRYYRGQSKQSFEASQSRILERLKKHSQNLRIITLCIGRV